jgi:dynein heavy chain 2
LIDPRSKSYRFEEFLSNWNDKLRSSKQTNITVRLIHEVERYKVILPVLKYVRGEIFSEQVKLFNLKICFFNVNLF